MSCFGGKGPQDLWQNCCCGSNLCQFDGDLSSVCAEPVYVQKVFDAVEFHLQGMKSVNGQSFYPPLPKGYRIKRVIDIRCRRSFNPANTDDESNLKLDVNTTISGASFLQNKDGDFLTVVGADGSFSQKLLYAETSSCDEQCKGTPVFGTQNIYITGNVVVELDLLVCDSCNNENVFTVCANVNVADACQPLILTNFFEICMPTTIDTAFLPRFTEFCNSACETRLATNNFGRDLCVGCDGTVSANLIIAICITCEKKIVVPVQLCVLSSGYVKPPLQHNAICQTFPLLFPESIRPSGCDCGCQPVCEPKCEPKCEPVCDPCCEPVCAPPCDPCCEPPREPHNNKPCRPQPRK